MPCYDSRNDPSNVWADAKADARHNSDVAELLCKVCRKMEAMHDPMSRELAVWWQEHKTRDSIKAEQEKQHRASRIVSLRATSSAALKELNRLLKKVK